MDMNPAGSLVLDHPAKKQGSLTFSIKRATGMNLFCFVHSWIKFPARSRRLRMTETERAVRWYVIE